MGKIITVSYSLTPSAVVAGPRMTPVTQEQFDAIVAGGLDKELAESMFRIRAPRTSSGSTRALRAVGAGGTCPYFGLDFVTDAGVHHPADCGKEHDGKFAKTGYRSSAGKPGTGYEGHMEWASQTSVATFKAARAAAAKKSS